MTSKVDEPKRAKTGGRKAGTPNKVGQDIQAMLKASLSRVGGIEYLVKQSEENPVAYMGMISKLLPRQVEAQVTHDGDAFNEILLKVVDGTTRTQS